MTSPSALLLVLALQSPEPAEAAAPPARDLAPLLAPLWEEHGVPALGGAVLDCDGLVAIGAVGSRSVEGDLDVTKDDRWHVGSCTKAMTATLVARLVEKKELSWDTTVGAAFAALGERVHAGWRDVPIALLLQNRGGAPGDVPRELWAALWRHEGTGPEQRAALVAGILAAPPEYDPGSRNVYSNAGFALAGAMAETMLDVPWEELMRREVFGPLGMRDVGFGAPGEPGKLDQPLGHRHHSKGYASIPRGNGDDNPAAIGPAGTVHASLESWARFARAHLCGARDGSDYLSRESWERLHEPPPGGDYAMGWGVMERPWGGGRVLTHSGSNTMWFATIWLAPEKGFGVLAVCNAGEDAAAKACDAVCSALIADHVARERASEAR